ncbi:LysR family transcriptional regulator [Pseudoduganella aquatica]|uniref:LysR family transcriptional regulator n=1 Tax=Pseudoduganella aquatica TaxID=2660641 RepID=A0A7X4H8N5_9BURK|nr:LysR family transcriptional regulator [Pseudoduganella aquatica]MYN05735.1 LysR family transcriptional regulator [Pseudoduganella aquatica]
MDQLQAIRAFARVVEAGSFTKAADTLGMPNATLTKSVQALEAHLRIKLLQRTTRRVSVTPEGAQYYEKTQRLLKELDDVDASFSAAQSRPRGHLRVDAGSSIASQVLLPALPAFLARYPDIRIDMGVSDKHVNLIGDNVDCVIRGGELTDLSLIGRQVGSASWVTCATPAYLRDHGTPKHPSELEQGHTVTHYLSTRTGRGMPLNFAKQGEKLEILGERSVGVNESNAHVAAGLAGLGVLQTFRYGAAPHIASGALVPILEDWRPAPYSFYVVYPSNRYVSNRLRVFIDWTADLFAALE